MDFYCNRVDIGNNLDLSAENSLVLDGVPTMQQPSAIKVQNVGL